MRFLNLAGACALFAVVATAAQAHEIKAGSLVIHHPWSRATPAGAQIAGGYTVIENTGSEPDKLIGGSFEAATGFEIHEMATKDGVMTMRPIAGGVVIPAHGKVEFKPGGLHLMFPGLKDRLNESDEIEGTLVFEKAGTVKVDYEVQGLASSQPEEKAGHDAGMKMD